MTFFLLSRSFRPRCGARKSGPKQRIGQVGGGEDMRVERRGRVGGLHSRDRRSHRMSPSEHRRTVGSVLLRGQTMGTDNDSAQ